MTAATITCIRCGDVLTQKDRVQSPGDGPTIEMYECMRENCGRRAAVIFEPEGGLTDDQQSWVETEIARRGSFFPGDYTGTRTPRQ